MVLPIAGLGAALPAKDHPRSDLGDEAPVPGLMIVIPVSFAPYVYVSLRA